jgi:Bacterial Ig-like domain (group 3)/FG-GAP-like repeat
MNVRLHCSSLFLIALVILLSSSPLACRASGAVTTTTLTVSSAGQAITSGGSLTAGEQLTLTASVAYGATKVTVGQVSFCDAAAPSCSDIHLLGTAQLTSAGTAVLSLTPAIGSHSYNAVFAATPHASTAYAGGTSSTFTFTVTGLYPSFATFTPSDIYDYPYTLSAAVGGNASSVPAGTLSFLNASDNNAVLGTASLSAVPPSTNFLNVSSFPFNWYGVDLQDSATPIVVGDFNGDGIPDIAGAGGEACNTGNCHDAAVGAALGDGKGNFTPAAILDLGPALSLALEPICVAVGDFNGDGKLDLAVGGYAGQTYSITILLGNGDGTFTNKGSVAAGGAFQAFAVGDFNGDGIPDLAVANTAADIVAILLGNGDGTFTPSTAATSPTGSNPVAIAVADFNGDGIPDLAIGNAPQDGSSGNVTILLGNGNGTFTAAASPATPSGVSAIAVADFSGDGKADIAVANGLTLTMLKGKGDGTFTSSTITPSAGSFGINNLIIIGDFNGDGKPDMAFSGYAFLLLGNGDGTFNAAPFEVFEPTDTGSFQIAVGADFNGDGNTDLMGVGNTSEVASGFALLAANQTATATATGITLPPATGTQQAVASFPSGGSYGPAISAPVTLYAQLGTPTVTLTASPNTATAGTKVTLTATVTGSAATPTGTVTFYDGSAELGSATLNGSGVATYATTALAVGANSVTASYGGGGNYNVANSTAISVTITPLGTTVPTVTVTATPTTITSAQTETVAVSVAGATGSPTPTGTVVLSSGTYSAQQPLASGAAGFTIPAGALSSGANTLTATYSGDGNYNTATGTTSVTVSPIIVSIPAPAAVSPGASATATATLTSGSYSGTLKLTCALTTSPSGAQSPPTCALNPASVALASGGTATSVLTIGTTAASTASLLEPDRKNLWGFGGGSAVLALLLMCGIPARRRRWMSMMVLLWIVVAGAAIGCGGGGTSTGSGTAATTAGNYTFTVTGTDSASAAITTSTTVIIAVH